ncbi:beta-L-arabinofuranosidase domain-containing protein [Candidatus Omnitrophota bacterium]
MKREYKLILVGFILGVVFLGMASLFLKKTKPFLVKVRQRLEERRLANTPRAKKELVICDFESADDFKRWKANSANVELTNEHVSSGKQSAKITFQPSNGASEVKMEDYFAKNKRMRNWAGYETLSFDIFNPYNDAQRIILQIKDKKSKRKKINLNLQANMNNSIKIDISELGGSLLLTDIIQINLFLWKNNKIKEFYLDNIRLLPFAALEKQNKNIMNVDFIPKQEEEAYLTGDYFSFDSSKWLKIDKEENIDFIEFPIAIRNYLSFDLKDLNSSGGIPFPRGQLSSLNNLELTDGKNNKIQFQAKILSRWPDDSIKWALLSLESDISAYEDKLFYLRYSDSFKNKRYNSTLNIQDGSDSITINTGVLKVDISKNEFHLFDNVWLDGNSDGQFDDNELISSKADLVLVHNGREYYSHLDKDYTLTIEEEGPIRACLKAEGWFVSDEGDRFCKFVVRMYAFQGASSLKVQHTFIYTGYPENNLYHVYKERKMPENETIDSAYIRMPLKTGEAANFTFAADNQIVQGELFGNIEFMQNEFDSYDLLRNGSVMNSGSRLRGWVDLSDNEKGVSLGIKNFWEQFPKGYFIDRDNNYVDIYLWPEKAGALDLRTTETAAGPNAFGRGSAFGLAKTHEMFFYFHNNNYEASAAKSIIEGLASDIVITANPEWVSATRVLGRVLPYDERFGSGEDFLSRLFDWGDRQIEDYNWYGMIDFGDTLSWYRKEAYDKSYDEWGWHPEGRWGWFNGEGVGTHSGALIQFLRTGSYQYLNFGKNLARHIMDIDTCHYNTVANDKRLRGYVTDEYSQVGSMHRHNGDHWGGRNEETSHTNVFGLVLYYYITGDERARDVIDEVGGFLLDERITYYGRPDMAPLRNVANVLWGDVLLYELTGDERYKQAADKWANLLYRGQKHDGSWAETYNPEGNRWEGKVHPGYIRGYTLPALIEYHKLTGNKAIADVIIKATDFVAKKEEWLEYFDASSYSYWITGDKKYLDDISRRMNSTIRRQRASEDPIVDGMIYKKAYYLRVMEYLYQIPFAFEVLLNENFEVKPN